MKDRQYNVVVPFLPITTDISTPDTIQHIEEGNELPSSSISQICWIKDLARRNSQQRVAHTMFSLTTPEAANRIIDQGLCIYLERFQPHKDKKEPIRCLKCQHWGHLLRPCLTPDLIRSLWSHCSTLVQLLSLVHYSGHSRTDNPLLSMTLGLYSIHSLPHLAVYPACS